MIGRLRGNILEKQPPLVLLEANGVGYEVHMPMTCFYELPELGQEAIVFTHFVVREDAQLLYGFNDKQERALFRRAPTRRPATSCSSAQTVSRLSPTRWARCA